MRTAGTTNDPTAVPPSGAGKQADKACRAAAAAAKNESEADEARRRGDWKRYYIKMKHAWGHWEKFYEAMGTPVPTKPVDGPIPPRRDTDQSEPPEPKE